MSMHQTQTPNNDTFSGRYEVILIFWIMKVIMSSCVNPSILEVVITKLIFEVPVLKIKVISVKHKKEETYCHRFNGSKLVG